jgi:ribonuclease HI
MRIGVVALRGEAVAHRISQPMGCGASNRARLLAVREALRWAPKDGPVDLHVDSNYVCGVISRGWDDLKNTELVAEIRELYRSCPRIEMVMVWGHAGVLGDELADRAAAPP